MAVKVLIKRRFKEGHLKEASILLNNIRYGAMAQRGYISSETLTDYYNPTRIIVVSMWQELDSWKKWRNSEQRKAHESEFDQLLEVPAEYEVYNVGMEHQK